MRTFGTSILCLAALVACRVDDSALGRAGDAERPDAGRRDGGELDAGLDAGRLDDGGPADGGPSDAAPDVGPVDAGPEPDAPCVEWGTRSECSVVEVSAGDEHACAVTATGRLYCWGANARGQLGDGTTRDSASPRRVALDDVVSVSAGAEHTCAVAGTPPAIHCWGMNATSQLGIPGGDATSPRMVRAGSQVAAGRRHTCGIDGDSLFCWGANGRGQLGNGTTILSPAPALADTSVFLGDPARVVAGRAHTCLLATSSQMRCWGANDRGQAVTGVPGPDLTRPAPAPVGVPSIRGLAGGGAHTCLFREGGEVRCVGAGNAGQLGRGSAIDSAVVTITPGIVATAISAGGSSTCAVEDGKVICWGSNLRGQIGDGTTTRRLVPTATDGLTRDALGVDVGESFACAALADGVPWCWGANGRGQLGAEPAVVASRATPAPVAAPLAR